MALGGAWAFARRDDSSVVETTPLDQSWPTFCGAAARISDDHQHPDIGGGTVVVPGLDADYAMLTGSSPDPALQQALVDAKSFLLAPIGYPYTPVELHAARTVHGALQSRCGSSTTIFGLGVQGIDVTLPPFERQSHGNDAARCRACWSG